MRVRVSPIPPPQSPKGRAPENDRSRHRETGRLNLLRESSPRARSAEKAARGGVSSGLRMHRDRSRKDDQGSAFPKRALRQALCGFEPRLGHCHSRASFNGRTAVFQTADVGSIPSARSVSSRFSDEERSLQNCVRGFDSLSALRPARSMDEHSPSKRATPGSNPGRGTLLSLTCRKQAPVYEAGCRGSTPRREAEDALPPSWRNQARASEARCPGSTPGGGAPLCSSEDAGPHKPACEGSTPSAATKIKIIWVWLNLARALGSEPRDCEFESRHPDHAGLVIW